MAEKRFDVAALGEFLIDFTQHGLSNQGNPLFEANPGGAPCNVLAMLQKLGHKTAFIGKVGMDSFGLQLRNTAEEAGIDTDNLFTDPSVHTTLAIVHTFENGDRDFSFYREPGADMMLREDELPPGLLENCKIFHFGTLSMTHEGVRAATKSAVRTAKNAGALISFDPNLRPPLWASMEEARKQMEWGFGECDILKISDNEVEFFTGETDYPAGARKLLAQFPNIRMLNVTCGPNGSYSFSCGAETFAPAFKLGGTIETTGAGDTFCACVLHNVLENGLERRNAESLKEMLRFSNAAAYLVTTKKGAIRAMPDPQAVELILKSSET